MVALGVENANNERPKIITCWCIQIDKAYLYVFLDLMAFYRPSYDKLTLGIFEIHLNFQYFSCVVCRICFPTNSNTVN